jgi:hypothetical protein
MARREPTPVTNASSKRNDGCARLFGNSTADPRFVEATAQAAVDVPAGHHLWGRAEAQLPGTSIEGFNSFSTTRLLIPA